MIVYSSSLVLTESGETDEQAPVIGWHNLVTPESLAADTEDIDHPVINLANPATDLLWRGQANDQYTALLLRGDGGSPEAIVDASPDAHAVVTVGDTFVDSAQSKFGGTSLRFDGTGDYVRLDGDDRFAFGRDDFTIDFWVRLNSLGSERILYDARPLAGDGEYAVIYLGADNFVGVYVDSTIILTSAAALTSGQWYHIALAREGTTTRLFVDGTLQSEVTDVADYGVGSQRPTIGAHGSLLGNSSLDGWIDELRVSNGVARWTKSFTPPSQAYHTGDQYVTITISTPDEIDYVGIAKHNLGTGLIPVSIEGSIGDSPEWFELVGDVILPDDAPAVFRFTPQSLSAIRIRFQEGDLAPEAAVVYVGRLLVLQRRIYVGHTPINYGRRVTIVNGRSESGNFLGRIVVGETRATAVNLQNITPTWYRENLDPFISASKEVPFFFVWRPTAYPRECGFAWMANEPVPVNQRANGMVQIDMQLGGIA